MAAIVVVLLLLLLSFFVLVLKVEKWEVGKREQSRSGTHVRRCVLIPVLF